MLLLLKIEVLSREFSQKNYCATNQKPSLEGKKNKLQKLSSKKFEFE